jgi:hypothetical protein
LPIAADHTVNCSHERGGLAEAIEIFDHLDFVGDGTIEALEAHDFGSPDGGFQIVGANFDGEVAPVQIMMAVGGLDHDLCWVFSYGLSKGSGKFLLEV